MKKLLLTLPLTLLALSGAVNAETDAAQRGLEIATEADKRDDGYGDTVADLEMILRNKQGEESVRYMRIKTLEVQGDGDKSMTIFDQPHDVKGTAFLTHSHAQGADDQWLYLPALKRVKRISSRNKSGPFMGSEFAYEDMASQEIEKYTYKFIGEEKFNGMDVYVLERYPTDKNSGYKRQISWLDKEHLRMQKVEFYDRKNALLKTLTASGYQQYLGKYWRPAELYMENHQTGKTTKLLWKNYKFGNDLSDRDFTKNTLQRAK